MHGLLCRELTLYLGWSALLVALVWRSWWWDFRVAIAVHIIDMVVFLSAISLADVDRNYASSPFIGFTAFLLITALARWGQRGVLLTACALVLSFGLVGGLFDAFGPTIDSYQFGRRMANMTALSLMIVWLAADVRVTRVSPMPEPGGIPGRRRDQILAGALAYARSTFHAHSAAIAVTTSEEPWVDLYCDRDGVFTHHRVGPGPLTEDFDPDADAALFDIKRCRRILALSDYRLQPKTGPFGHALADACDVSGGLLARMTSASGHGQMLVWGVADACIDDLPVITILSRDVGLALDREEMAAFAQSIAVSSVRNALARDLHDSVAQLLAGTLFRLEALRRGIREGRDPDSEIVAMREALGSEQQHVRTMIERLRRGIDGNRTTDIVEELTSLIGEMGQHWQITTTITSSCPRLPVSIDMAHELRQLVREAVANAVRHGQCSRVDLVLDHTKDNLLQISIDDNGSGFAAARRTHRPRSISERIEMLGGQLRIASGVSGARLDIALPLPIAA